MATLSETVRRLVGGDRLTCRCIDGRRVVGTAAVEFDATVTVLSCVALVFEFGYFAAPTTSPEAGLRSLRPRLRVGRFGDRNGHPNEN